RERIQLDEPRANDLRVRFADVARRLRGNVIRLTVERNLGDRPGEKAAGERSGAAAPQIVTIDVSGVVLDPVGHVVTFGNVLAQADRVSVRFVNLQGVRPRRARIIGTDPETDVGVLDVGPIALPALALGAPNGAAPAGASGFEAMPPMSRDPAARMVVSM